MRCLRYILAALTVVACATPGFTQNPPTPPRDTTRVSADTLKPVADSARARAARDSVKPIPQIVQLYAGPANGFTDGVWYWDEEAFKKESAITLGDLLERIPGVVVLRSGFTLQPEAASVFGAVANRLEVWLDGYALDPLLESSIDLAKLELAEVSTVRIERRLGVTRIQIQTLAPKDNRSYSRIEAGVSQPNANLFRGIFLGPKFLVGPFGVAIDRLDAAGLRGDEPADQFAGWLKWSFIRNTNGLQLEYRRTTTDRDPNVPWAEKFERSDLILRARTQLRPGLVAELFGGRSKAAIDTTTVANDSAGKIVDESSQFGGRVSYESALFWGNASVRMRDAEALPSLQLDAEVGIRHRQFSLTGMVGQADWRNAGSATTTSLRAEAGPWRGITLFGETTKADHGVPYLDGLPKSTPVMSTYSASRIGAQILFRGITLGGAYLKVKTDSVYTFGLPFDRTTSLYTPADAKGWEVSGRVPLFVGFAAIGILTDWSGPVSLYMPPRIYRTGIEYSATPMKSGNLQVTGRIELIHRGEMFAPNFTPEEPPTTILPALDYYDMFLQVRIIDVRIFVRYEDLRGVRELSEIPGRGLGGPRIFYGIAWQFFN